MSHKKYFYIGVLIFLVIFSISAIFFVFKKRPAIKDLVKIENLISPEISSAPQASAPISIPQDTEGAENSISIKESVNLEIPFTPQAPFANWDKLHSEACEEASVLMAIYYLQNKRLDRYVADDQILKMVHWQNDNFGGHYDLSVAKTAELVKKYFSFEEISVKYDISIDDIKKELSLGHVVVVPSAGRYLKNPYFKQPGPYYHMLVIRGYDDKGFITNDPGTKHGQNFSYTYQNLFNAIHDWNDELNIHENEYDILAGRKAMIIFGE